MNQHKTVLHVHTNFSHDSNTSPRDLIETARRQGVTCIGVTDHDEVRGALEARELAPDLDVVVGEEISSAEGHIIGLFLKRRIAPGLSAERTIGRIREQGGLVLIPHPFLGRHGVGRHVMDRVIDRIDAVEVCNGQNPLPHLDTRALLYAARNGLTAYVGADVHVRGHLDVNYQMLPTFVGPAGFRDALARADLFPGRFGPRYFATMAGHFTCAKVLRRRFRGFGQNWQVEVTEELRVEVA